MEQYQKKDFDKYNNLYSANFQLSEDDSEKSSMHYKGHFYSNVSSLLSIVNVCKAGKKKKNCFFVPQVVFNKEGFLLFLGDIFLVVYKIFSLSL